jgi:hypothetical protein
MKLAACPAQTQEHEARLEKRSLMYLSSAMFHSIFRRALVRRGVRLLALGCSMLIIFLATARAQQSSGAPPQLEVSGGYAYTHGVSDSGLDFNLNGGTVSLAYNFHNRLAVVGDFGVYRFSDPGPGLTSTMYTYLVGPRVALRRSRSENRIVPFAQVLLGGGRLNASAGGVDAGENGFAMAVGGGLNVAAGRRFSIRLVEANYLLTRFNHPDGSSATQNNVRISAGIVFHFGNR